ncbi:hypothetical protein [Maritimibacter sp. DP1N21-5]|uniref:hypothetical protein n=1 Tax=Maritimibacter sp. DP1N21-5 TaxID=2836867 RepID=UPI001C4620AA|nr:hypothetical protein [Maritimibacter sp. DP1N21-5]MBV7408161.1 hypothetical protein [Maritimibacter sp. DP1N21-5]
MLTLTHLLHLIVGVTWAGGNLFFALCLMPAMARRPADEAHALFEGIGRAAGLVMGVSGALVLITGPIRAVVGGGIGAVSDVFTPYGLMVLASFVIAVAVAGIDGASRGRLRRAFDNPATYPAVAGAVARRNAWVTSIGMLAVILIMGAMGLGLY